MPVNRANFAQYASDPATINLYQSLAQIADVCDALEKASGVTVGTRSSGVTSPPRAASWSIVAANGHFLVTITGAAGTGTQPAIQHEVMSATNQNFDANSNSTTYTLGLGQLTLDIVDPNGAPKFFRIHSRYQGSAWNSWLTYASASGVAPLSAGALPS